MNRTLYYATLKSDICVAVSGKADLKSPESVKYIRSIIEKYFKEQFQLTAFPDLDIKEVKTEKDVPKDWRNACFWGENENDETVKEFILSNDEATKADYATYLELKARFEP
jgi:hypothetical protein